MSNSVLINLVIVHRYCVRDRLLVILLPIKVPSEKYSKDFQFIIFFEHDPSDLKSD